MLLKTLLNFEISPLAYHLLTAMSWRHSDQEPGIVTLFHTPFIPCQVVSTYCLLHFCPPKEDAINCPRLLSHSSVIGGANHWPLWGRGSLSSSLFIPFVAHTHFATFTTPMKFHVLCLLTCLPKQIKKCLLERA